LRSTFGSFFSLEEIPLSTDTFALWPPNFAPNFVITSLQLNRLLNKQGHASATYDKPRW
jgi:hypothetical protein